MNIRNIEKIIATRLYDFNFGIDRTEYDSIAYELARKISDNCSASSLVDDLEQKQKEANQFIIEIAEMLNIETDGLGYDGLQLSLDDFQEAINRLRAREQLVCDNCKKDMFGTTIGGNKICRNCGKPQLPNKPIN